MIDFIKTTTENIFENQSPIFTFNSWKRGSVVCDYEIKFVQPIRELSIEATGPSPADLFLANLGSAFQDIEFEPNNNQFKHHFFFNQLTDTGENVQKWTRVFRLGAESYSSLGRVGKKKENSVSTFGLFRLWTSFESSPVSVKTLRFKNSTKSQLVSMKVIPGQKAENQHQSLVIQDFFRVISEKF